MTDIITQLTELDPYMDVHSAYHNFVHVVAQANIPYTNEFCVWAFKWARTQDPSRAILITEAYATYLKEAKFNLIKDLLIKW